ncbi:retinol dehydrogenase [Colletotrichum fioriniae PJ7]|uniref:Retinol dehydrogenase n=1 Tax=Colletotrichum fioriniae PJ7 TaxID=1445577 RepID=A0A010QPM4_9PEZI|nr:retinol dehydrogenase [Colletotrichum fioriniae PJ7]
MAPLVWLITGSTSGFGAEFVKALLAKGDKVIATARDTSKIAHFREAGAAVLKLDLLADQAEFDKVAQDSLSIYGSVDVLVNNAGYSHFGTIEDDSQEDWNKVFQTHLFGPLGTTRAFLPHFRARKSGTFVFIGAVEALNLEVAPLGLKTLLVEPGFFRTELLNANNTVYVETKIPDYKPIVDPLYAQFKGAHQQQPGDPAKAVSRIIDTVGSRGSAQGRPLPVSLALGPDAVSQLTKKCADTIKLVDDWKEVSSDTLL